MSRGFGGTFKEHTIAFVQGSYKSTTDQGQRSILSVRGSIA